MRTSKTARMKCVSNIAFFLCATAVLSCAGKVDPGVTASRLVFRQVIASTYAGEPLPRLEVEVLDATGALVEAPTTVVLGTTNGSTLGGATIVRSENGVATFADIFVTTPGADVALVATCATAEGESSRFTVAEVHLGVRNFRNIVLTQSPFSFHAVLTDSSGALVNSSRKLSGRVLDAPDAATLTGALDTTFQAGIARIDGVTTSGAGTGFKLEFTTPGTTALVVQFASAFSTDEKESADTTTQPNGTAQTAEPLWQDVPLFGRLSTLGDVDMFKFEAAADDLVSIQSVATRLDAANWSRSVRLRLFDTDGTTVLFLSDRDGGSSLDNGIARVRMRAAGTYFVAADVDGGGAGGQYALVLHKSSKPADFAVENEPEGRPSDINGSNPTAEAGARVLVGFHDSNERDTFRYDVSSVSRVRFEVIAARNGIYTSASRPFDSHLAVHSSAGVALFTEDDNRGLDALGDAILAPGTHWAHVYSVHANDAAPYLITASIEPVTFVQEASGNTSSASPAPLTFDGYVQGTFAATEAHYFSFTGTAGDRIRVRNFDRFFWEGAAGEVATITLYETDGTTVLNDGQNLDRVDHQAILPATGAYLVEAVGRLGGAFGLQLEKLSSGSFETEGSVGTFDSSGWAAGLIGTAGDTDRYSFSAQEGQLVTLELHGRPGPVDLASAESDFGSSISPQLTVFAPSSAVLSTTSFTPQTTFSSAVLGFAQNALSPGAAQAVSFRAPATGSYEVEVKDTDSSAGGSSAIYAVRLVKND